MAAPGFRRHLLATLAMHVVFVHQTYPSQFGHVARYLTERHGFQCTFVCRNVSGSLGGVECIQYPLKGGATHLGQRNPDCRSIKKTPASQGVRAFEGFGWPINARGAKTFSPALACTPDGALHQKPSS